MTTKLPLRLGYAASLMSNSHTPVMLQEVLHYLSPKAGEIYLDTTFGAGGYSEAILQSCNCSVIGLDQDPSTKIYAGKLLEKYNERFDFIETNFADYVNLSEIPQYNGIVMDLGVSSMQLDQGERGFSFMKDGPLDMRMKQTGDSVADFINLATQEEIADVIYKYGDEHGSRKIAKKIVEERLIEPIVTTTRLANIVRSVLKTRGKIDAATKTFQALRIHINNELGALEQFLQSVEKILKPGGRLIVVSFHSLEDRIVKSFVKEYSAKKIARSKYAKALEAEPGKWISSLSNKVITPSKTELKNNVRSRSAKLRAVIKEEHYAS